MKTKDHDLALSAATKLVDVLSARPRADLEREVDRGTLFAARARARVIAT